MVDVNNNGDFNNDLYLDRDGDGRFYADTDGNGLFSFPLPGDGFDFDGDGDFEPVVDSLWSERVGVPVRFDHTGGVDANGRGAYVDRNVNGVSMRATTRSKTTATWPDSFTRGTYIA